MAPPAPAAARLRRRRRIAVAGAALCAGLFVLLAFLVTARHGAPYPLDSAAHRWSVRHRPAVAVAFARAVTSTGSGPFPYVCAAAAGVIAGRGTRERLWGAAAALLFLGFAQAARFGVLHLIGRPRPALADWATVAHDHSFPSGHTTASALAAGLLAWALLRRAGPAAAAIPCVILAGWAVAVGLTRIYLGVHWPTDVLAGWLYALTWFALGYAVFPYVLRMFTDAD
ncbi:phosphatase PAP2 family protein [Streptomyces goshikiensis]|uniref:phosphatase PAP2 family protein n=1 Tax=Streptomyces goshikiensis TaxID=1942 RepID=UPI0036B32EB9